MTLAFASFRCVCVYLCNTNTRTHARTHARARTHTHIHTRTTIGSGASPLASPGSVGRRSVGKLRGDAGGGGLGGESGEEGGPLPRPEALWREFLEALQGIQVERRPHVYAYKCTRCYVHV